MKTLILIFLAFMLCFSSFAQSPLKDGKYSYDGKTFKVTKHTYLEKNSFSVRAIGRFEDKRPPAPKDPHGYPTNKKDIHFDIDKVKEIINNVLSVNEKNLMKNKDRIDLSFTFLEEDGSVENISYFFNNNTLISLKEIAKIDREIKKSIKATFTGKEHNNFYLISYGEVSVVF